MIVNLIDADNTGFPNLALMKLSAHWKAQGAEVLLNSCRPADKVFISCVFRENMPKALKYQRAFGGEVGGSGTSDYAKVLPAEIEHTCPDYSLYGIEHSLGFLSRGCFRSFDECPFCIVRDKEGGKVQAWSPLAEFVRHKSVTLMDNNFFGLRGWKALMLEMIRMGLKVDFNQGLDIRLMTEEKADLLTWLNPPYLRFAWDNVTTESDVFHGIHLLAQQGWPINRHRIGFYVLIGFNSTREQDLYRLNKLHSYDINTHVQVYEKNRENNRLSRWGNQPRIWRNCRFEDYKG